MHACIVFVHSGTIIQDVGMIIHSIHKRLLRPESQLEKINRPIDDVIMSNDD